MDNLPEPSLSPSETASAKRSLSHAPPSLTPQNKRANATAHRTSHSEPTRPERLVVGLDFDTMAARQGLAKTPSTCGKCMELQVAMVKPPSCPVPSCRLPFHPSTISPDIALARALASPTKSQSARSSLDVSSVPHTMSTPHLSAAAYGLETRSPAPGLGQLLQQALGESSSHSLDSQLDYSGLNNLISTLVKHRNALQSDTRVLDLQLCEDFLRRAHDERRHQVARLQREMVLLSDDTTAVQTRIAQLRESHEETDLGRVPSASPPISATRNTLDTTLPARQQDLVELQEQAPSSQMPKHELLVRRKARIYKHFDDLERAYFEAHTTYGRDVSTALNKFQSDLTRFTKYCGFEVVSQLKYGNLFNTSSIISSIEFDRDETLFATAGVSKKIRVYEYRSVVGGGDDVEMHMPMITMACRTKISCLSWNPYFRDHIASADYEGVVQLWNASTGDKIMAFEEHEKRTWSVDTSATDPTTLASGSDDHRVKIWSTRARNHSVATIPTKANVCCVKFDPTDSRYLAFGSADHHVHYYDLRNLSKELATFKGHSKAVSYVRFLSSSELVSASTDSSLKLWNLKTNACTRTFVGHRNDKNFVGLTSNGDYLACGSEDNAVYVYYKTLEKPIVMHTCNTVAEGVSPEQKNFVSSVAWRKQSDVILAANSLGIIHLLRLK